MRTMFMVSLLAIGTALGCSDYKPAPVPPAGSGSQQVSKPAPAPAPAPAPKVVVEKADVGVGAKGRDYGEGLITTPVAQYFAAREAIVFRIQVPEALKLYKATNGHAPQTLEEFVQVMKDNKIKLPVLRPGCQYVYDPKKEELQVMHPKQ